MKPKATVIQFRSHWLGTTEQWLFTTLRRLPESVESHIITEKTQNLSSFALPNLHCLYSDSRFGYWRWRALKRLKLAAYPDFIVRKARALGAQILHSHYGPAGWANIGAAEKAGLKHVVTFYGFDLSLLPKSDPVWLDRYAALFRTVDSILCEGPHMAKCVVSLGCPEKKVVVQRIGIDLGNIRYCPRKFSKGEPLKVLIAGTFREKKGIPYALEAAGIVRKRGIPISVTVIGGQIPDEERSAKETLRIMDAIRAGDLENDVQLLGFQPHERLLEEAYKCHVFLSPSVTASDGDTEGGAPITIIEAAASGMPVVSTTHCDIPQIIEHEKSGFLAPERDAEALADYLERLATHPNEWAKMTQAARSHIEANFDAVKQGEGLAAIYRELLGG